MLIIESNNLQFNAFLMVNKVAIFCSPTTSYNPLSSEEIETLATELKAVNPFFIQKGNSGYLVATTFKEVEGQILSQILDGNYVEGTADERGLRPTRIVVDHPLMTGLAVLYYEKAKENKDART